MTKNSVEITIAARELKFVSERFKVEGLTYQLGDSELYAKDVIRHPGAVVILAIDSGGCFSFVSQPRLALGKTLLELPAGTRGLGEDPLVCAKRELAEEVGLAAAEWIPLGFIYPAPGFCDEQLFLFVAKGLSKFQLPADKEERITVQKLSSAEITDLINDGTLQDAKSLALLYKAKLAGVW